MNTVNGIDYRKLRQAIDGEGLTQLKARAYQFLESEPEFKHPFGRLTLADRRKLTFDRINKLFQFYMNNGFDESRIQRNAKAVENGASNTDENVTQLLGDISIVLAFGMYDWSTQISGSLAWLLPYSMVRGLGTEAHEAVLKKVEKNEARGCIMLTELTHGTNVREIQTRARFDADRGDFVFDSPNIGALKCWSGNLAGGVADYGVVFAQLEVGGVRRGVHPFLLRLRDENTGLPVKGLSIGDMGEKVGMHGLANGWAAFHQLRAPRSALLNRLSDVTPSGEYVSPFGASDGSSNSDGFGLVLLGALSDGRVGITAFGVGGMILSLTIALRYAHARKQYPVPVSMAAAVGGERELSIMEFQLQQTRLLPHLAATYCWYYYVKSIFVSYMVFKMRLLEASMSVSDIEAVREIHALSCAGKAQSGWLAMQMIQEARESCGGHGYLHAARLGEIREDHDANLTWEGDNNVLIQQTSNYLLNVFEKNVKQSPLHSIDFIGAFDFSQFETRVPNARCVALSRRFTAAAILSDSSDKFFLVEILQHLVCHLVWKYANKLKAYVGAGLSKEEAKLRTQSFYCKPLGVAYIETFVLTLFYNYAHDRADQLAYPCLRLHSTEYATTMHRMFTLYACTVISKYVGELFEAGLVTTDMLTICRDCIADLSAALKPDCLPLIDALAPTDFVVNSVLAHSDSATMYAAVTKSLLQSSHGSADPKSLPPGLIDSKL